MDIQNSTAPVPSVDVERIYPVDSRQQRCEGSNADLNQSHSGIPGNIHFISDRKPGDVSRLDAKELSSQRSRWRLRADEKRHIDRLLAQRAALAVPLSTVFILFSALDWVVYPEHAYRWLMYRLGMFGIVCAIDWLAVIGARRRGFFLAALYSLAYSSTISLMTYESGGFASGYYVGLLTLAAAIFLIFPMQCGRGASIAALIIAPYFVLNSLGTDAEPARVVNNTTFLFATAGFFVLGGHLSTRLIVQQYRDQSRMRGLIEQLEDASRRDPLTNLFNRRFLGDYLTRALSKTNEAPIAFAVADLDYFKCVNDQFGHQAGDYILTEVAHVIRDAIRADDVVFRYGGEEFAIIFSSTDANEAQQAAERLRREIDSLRLAWQGNLIDLSASIGVTTAGPGDAPEDLIRRADQALYRAKGAGRNQIVVA